MPRKFRHVRLVGASLVTLVMASGSVRPDVVLMNNGDRITGDIKKVWDEELFIEPAYGDEFSVDLAAVASITSDRTFEIELRDHREIVGIPTTDAEGNPVLVTDGQARPFPVTEIEELGEPEDYFDWELRTDFAANVSRGNSDTTNWRSYNFGMAKVGDHRHRLEIILERQQKDGDTSKEQDEIIYGYNWLYAEDWFLIVNASWRRDPQRDLDARWLIGGGPGFQIWDDAYRTFQVGLTGDAVFEEIGGQKEESFAPRWGMRFAHDLLGGDVEFFHNHNIWTYVSGRDNNVFETSTGFRYEITDDIYVNLQVNFNYETDPAANAENQDVAYLVGIGVELD